MQKGRPPKNPIEELTVKTVFSAIEMLNPQLNNGYQLEKHFEPHLIKYCDGVTTRSNKWDRYLKGTMPNKVVRKLIYDRYPNAAKYFDISLWEALKAGNQSLQYWSDFYFQVDEELRNLCYRFKSTKNASFASVGKQKARIIDALVRISTLESLSCLIALLRESAHHENIVEHDALESALFNSIFWTLGQVPFYSLRHEILHYLKTYTVRQGLKSSLLLRSSPWNLSNLEVDRRIIIDQFNTGLAEDLGLLINLSERQEFLYWILKGDSSLIMQEMHDARKVEKYETLNSPRGLRWLIDKLNKNRSNDKKQDIHFV